VRSATTPRVRLARSATLPCAAVLVFAVAAINFLAGVGQPAAAVWDESYYLTSIQRYEERTAQFASHPPLGLMLLTAGDRLLHRNASVDTRALGRAKKVAGDQMPPGYSIEGARAASGLFAVLGALLFFTILYVLTRSVVLSLVLSNLYVFDNALIVHFRAAHLDAFQLAFCAATLLCLITSVRHEERDRDTPAEPPSHARDFLLGVFCGLATMVKLNAIVLLLSGAMLIARRLIRSRLPGSRRLAARLALRDGAIMLCGLLAAVMSVFTIHVAITPNAMDAASAAGQKDRPFVSPVYSAYLQGDRGLSPSVVIDAARDYMRFVSADYRGMTKFDPNASVAWQWPFQYKTINYRWDSDGTHTAYVQLVANPVSWGVALLAPLAAIVLLALRWLRPIRTSEPERAVLMAMLLIQYATFLGVHCYLGMHRVMYLYHYFIGLLLAFCLVPLVLQEAAARWPALRARGSATFAAATGLLLSAFVFYAPFTFDHPLTHSQCEWRNVLHGVVRCLP
jgi:dolichyl-phosphate-mannose-protein mannosyltransferase